MKRRVCISQVTLTNVTWSTRYHWMFVNFNMVADMIVEILLDSYGLWFEMFLFPMDVGHIFD